MPHRYSMGKVSQISLFNSSVVVFLGGVLHYEYFKKF